MEKKLEEWIHDSKTIRRKKNGGGFNPDREYINKAIEFFLAQGGEITHIRSEENTEYGEVNVSLPKNNVHTTIYMGE